ncbi:MAG: mannose-1-phosphate guanylyltransferase [Lewinellaceae bacterium]|nr:mannose-1-phosphate guanylyltransferase [Lewinellaceae bacterium]
MNNTSNTYVAIMAGGVGSRFWPASRESKPKQFLDILGVGKSLLQLTFDRFLELCPGDRIFIVTNLIYKDLVKEQLPQISDNQILCEPVRNNTAPCVAYTAAKLYALDPDANLIIAPSDHLILNQPAFLETVRKGLAFAESRQALVTLGIQPSHPHTGYGYIQFERQEAGPGVHKVVQFTEKPPFEQAKAFLQSGDYLWNAGIFIWQAQTILAAFEQYSPDIFRVFQSGMSLYNTAEEQAFINKNYGATPNISVDYAIMEQARNVYTIPSSFGWSDLGAWGALHAESARDESGNAIQAEKIILEDTHNCLVRVTPDKLAIIGGLDDLIIIDEGDVLLIWPKNREQEIKAITRTVSDRFGTGLL